MINVSYSPSKDRLIYAGKKSSSAYWDEHWLRIQGQRARIRPNHRLVQTYTPKFLKPPAKVLDAGCGLAESVATLNKLGFEGIGLDYAESSINLVKTLSPELNVLHGDIHALPFDDHSINGIWSLGVIEHFWSGYDSILKEMARVLTDGGYAFVTFPSISALRRIKISLNIYEILEAEQEPGDFYQFALNASKVISDFQVRGFRKLYQKKLGGFKGLKDEIPILRQPLQKIYDDQRILFRGFRYGLDRVLAPISNHTTLVVFQKT